MRSSALLLSAIAAVLLLAPAASTLLAAEPLEQASSSPVTSQHSVDAASSPPAAGVQVGAGAQADDGKVAAAPSLHSALSPSDPSNSSGDRSHIARPANTHPGALRQEAAHRFLARRGISWESRFSGSTPRGTAPVDRIQEARAQQRRLLEAAAKQRAVSFASALPPAVRPTGRPVAAGVSRLPQAALTSDTSSATSSWGPLGPAQVTTPVYGPVTGRVTSLAADPGDATGNTLYFGSTGGGVWKSTNAAGSQANVIFVPLTDDLPAFSNTLGSLSIGALTVQPASPSVVLAATGEINDATDSYYGVGILRSADGGNTWSLIGGSHDAQNGGLQNYSFVGNGFAGFAWSSVNPNFVVAAVASSLEGELVNAGSAQNMEDGLYYSSDAGQTWYLAVIEDSPSQIVQSPNRASSPPGNSATSVIWNPVRKRFYAAVRFHGYYESTDGITWTRLANQPGPTLTTAACPTNAGGTGQTSCPIGRGVVAVQPLTGDLFTLTADAYNQDQGIYQDVCSSTGGPTTSCASNTVTFAQQLPSAALENGNGDPTIAEADYNLTMAAVPSQGDTILFAGTEDIYRCSLNAGCAWRNTTNSENCAAAQVAPSQHAIEATFGANGLLYFGNDGGLWRTTDTVGQTGSVCAATDANHFQNLNPGLGSLAEIEHFSISPTTPSEILAGMGSFGTIATTTGQGAWQQLLTGEGSYTAIDPANAQNFYTDAGAGVNIHRCTAGANCNPSGFGSTPAIGSAQVSGDADYYVEAAPWILDPINSANMLVGTCRVWRGPATGGSGWSSSNVLSLQLDTGQPGVCTDDAELRSIGGGTASAAPPGSEQVYAGMAGPYDGGGVAAGHVYTATIPQSGGIATWTDLYTSSVTNSSTQPQFNVGNSAISSIAVDPHDATGQTVYVTVQGFSGNGTSSGELYGSTNGGATWINLTNSLPLAPANSVVVDPNVPSILYVALDTGVYYTKNVSACADPTQTCWAVYGAGLPTAPVTSLQIDNNGAKSMLEAATYGRGIWGLGLLSVAGQGSLLPASYTFAAQQTQITSSPVSFTLTNTGPLPFTIQEITATGDYTQTSNCGAAVAAGGSCTIQVTFAPSVPGDRPGLLQVFANVSGSPLTSTLDGTGLAPGNLSIAPTSLTFASTAEGMTSASQGVSVQNTGGIAVPLQPPTVTPGYTLSANSCGASLAPGASCLIQVAFAPTSTGSIAGQLSIPSSLPSSPVRVPLSGTAVAPAALTLSPTSLTFAATAVASVSAPQAITVTSSGGVAVQLQSPGVSAGYQITANTCGTTLAPAATCSIQVAFAPSTTGPISGLLTLSANVPGGAVTAALNGTGATPPSLTFTPSSVSFPATTVGATSAATPIQLTNSGGATAQLQAPAFTGNYALSSQTCGATLAAGASCNYLVTFAPAVVGSRSGTMSVAANVTGGQVVVPLNGTGLSPTALTLSPPTLTFGSTVQGASAAAQSITVTSSGGTTVQLQAPSITGDFSIAANSCGATLAPAAACTVQILFTPSQPGTRTGTLTIPANVAGGQVTAALTGTGTAPAALTFAPPSLTFAATAQGASSPAQSITVTSSGGATAQLQSPSISGDFQITGNTCGASLAPTATCVLQIAFSPTAVGSRSGLLTLPANVVGGAATASLSGTGTTAASLTLSPASLSFPATAIGVASAPRSIQLTSSGGVAVQLKTPSFTGNYALGASNCGSTLAPGASCTLQIVFTPTAAGDRPGELTLSGNVVGGQLTAALDGAGLAPAALSFTPSALTFPGTARGATSAALPITLTNSGGSPAQLQSAAATGDYAVAASTCPAQLAPAASCTLQITFTPTALGSRSGLLTLAANVPGGFVSAPLSGTGVTPPAVNLSPSPANFGSVVQRAASAPLSITVTSTGGAAVQLGNPSVVGDYQISANSCGAALAPGATCVIQVIFHPGYIGNRIGTLVLPGSMAGGVATDALSGTGLAPDALSLSPTSQLYTQQVINTASSPNTITVTNNGGVSVTLLPPTVTGDYRISSNTCGPSLSASDTCAIGVVFDPTVAGSRPGQLVVPGSISGGEIVATLDGVGLTPGTLAILPNTINFGSVIEGTTSSATAFAVTNSGGVAVHLQSTTVSGDYSVSANTCTGSLAPNATCTLQVTFSPTALGSRSGILDLTSDAINTPIGASLSGTGVAPAIVTLAPSSLTFPATVENSDSVPKAVTVTNSGGVAATLSAPLFTGGYQLVANTCANTLAAGASCTLQIVFAPTATGDRPGTLSLPGGYSGSPSSISLDGTGVVPGQLTLAPLSLSYSAVVVGASSTPQSIAVSNTGGASVTLQPATVTGDYQIAVSTCGSTLAPASSCTLQIVFHPSAVGDRPGQLVVPANVASGQVTAALDGSGLAPASLALSPSTLTFSGAVQSVPSAPVTLSVTNSGGATAHFKSASTTGDFSIASNGCGSSLAAGATCTLQIVFTPSTLGSRTGTFSLASDAPGSPTTAPLSGTGLAPASLVLTPTQLAFASTAQGVTSPPLTETITNIGGVPATAIEVSVTGNYGLASNTCTANLAGGASCALQVTFTPAALGQQSGALTLSGQFSGSPTHISIAGMGVPPSSLTLTPGSLSFGSVLESTASSPQMVTLTNPGEVSVTLGSPSVSSQYSIAANTCGASLAPSAACTLQIVFTPTAAGDEPGLLTIPASIAGGQVTAGLVGSGLLPGSLTFAPASLIYPSTLLGASSPAQALTLANAGGVSLALQAPVLSPDYQLVSSTCGGTLAPGATCLLQVLFHPTLAGDRPGTLSVSGGSGAGQRALASLDGSGIAPANLSFTPNALAFGAVPVGKANAPQSVTLTNSGGATAQLQTPLLTGDYQISNSTCNTTLAPGTTCALAITFTPSALGDRPGALTVSTLDDSTIATVTLDGSGTPPPVLVATPSSVTFGATVVGSTAAVQNVTVANIGSTVVTLQPPSITGDFAVSVDLCTGTPLRPNYSCTLSITFTPSTSGTRSGVLTIGDSSETHTVPLSGIGLSSATDTLSPSALSFATQLVGTTSAPQTVSLTNSGGTTLNAISTSVTGPFAATNNCGTQLGGGLSCAIAVVYVPTGSGPQTGLLTVSDGLRTQSVTLAGQGSLPPGAIATPTSLNFGGYALAATSAAQQVTFTNNGQTVVSGLTAATGTSSFTVANNTCSDSIAPGTSCQIGITFTPQQIGNQEDVLTLSSPSLNGPLTVALSGSGEDFQVAVSGATNVTLTSGQTANYAVVITPIGTSSGALTITCSGAPANSVCTANPAQLNVSAHTTGSVSVSIATGVAPAAQLRSSLDRSSSAGTRSMPGSVSPPAPSSPGSLSREARWSLGGAMALLLPFFVLRGSARRTFAILLAAALLVLAPTACGVHASGGSFPTTGTGTGTANSTPPGTYTITITASFPGAQRAATVTLVVQ